MIYYAHCIAEYGTGKEAFDIEMLENLGHVVLNPADKAYTKGWKEKGMAYAYDLLQQCRGLIFRRLPDGRIPAGVGYEIDLAIDFRMPILEFPSNFDPVMTREETREYIRKHKPNWYK